MLEPPLSKEEIQAMKLPYSGYLRRPARPVLLYYITDRRQFPGDPEQQKRHLLSKIADCIAAGVDYIQLREKDLSIRALEELAQTIVELFPRGSQTRLLVNSRTDVALACGASGVHLPSNDISASEARAIFGRARRAHPLIGVSVHGTEELSYADAHGADFAVFGPVFEKDRHGTRLGLEKLEQACHKPDRATPVLALGGITLETAQQCLAAGADGIAAIRLFQENEIAQVVRQLRYNETL
jgi:thiamine-phosphate pyrophosphorylase